MASSTDFPKCDLIWEIPVLITPEVLKESERRWISKQSTNYAKVLKTSLLDSSAKYTILKRVGLFFDYSVVPQKDNDSVGVPVICKMHSWKDVKEMEESYKTGQLEKKLQSYFENVGLPAELGIGPLSTSQFQLTVSIDSKYITKDAEMLPDNSVKNSSLRGSSQPEKERTDHADSQAALVMTNQRPPGSYPGKTTQNPPQRISKEKQMFRVCIPMDSTKIISVRVYSDEAKEINGQFLLNLHGTQLWETRLDVPLDKKMFTYWYEFNSDSSTYMPFFKFKLKSNTKYFISDLFCPDKIVPVHIDILEPTDGKIAESYCAHSLHILNSVRHNSVEESIIEIQDLKKYMSFIEFDDARSMIKKVSEQLLEDHACTVHHCFTFLAFLVETVHISLHLDRILSSAMSKTVLKQCSKANSADIPAKDISRYYQMIEKIYICADGWNANLLGFANYIYPLFNIDFLHRALQDMKRGTGVIKLSFHELVPSKILLKDLLQRLLVKTTENTKELAFITTFQRGLPFEMQTIILDEISKCESESKSIASAKETCTDILHSLCQRNLIDPAKKGDIIKVIEAYEDMLGSKFIWEEKIKDTAENAVIESIAKASDVQLLAGHRKLKDLCISECLFHDGEMKKKLLRKLAKSNDENVHCILIQCFNKKFFQTLSPSDLYDLIIMWFEHGVKHHCGDVFKRKKLTESLTRLYCYVGDVITNPWLASHAELMDEVKERAFNSLKGVEVADVIKTMPEIEKRNDTAIEDVFRIHIQKLLKDGLANKDIDKKELFGYAQKCIVNSRVTLDFFFTCMDCTGLTSTMPLQDAFLLILDYELLWKCILTVSGKKKRELQQHDLALKARSTIMSTKNLIEEKKIEKTFFEKLIGRKDQCFSFFGIDGGSISRVDKSWKLIAKNLADSKKKLMLILDVYKEIEKVYDHNCEALECVTECVKHFSQMQHNLSKGKMKVEEVEKEVVFTKAVEESIEQCEFLKHVIKSQVFWNIGQVHLKYYKPDTCAVSDSSEEDGALADLAQLFEEDDNTQNEDDESSEKLLQNITSGCCLLKFLSTQILTFYKEFWTPLLDGDDVHLSPIGKHFQQTDFKEEVSIAECILGKNINSKILSALTKYFEFEKHAEKVESMRMALKAFGLEFASDENFLNALSEYEKLLHGDIDDLTLFKVNASLLLVEGVTSHVHEDVLAVLKEISRGSTLIEFLKTVVDDDIRNLIDAVEEHSEQYVRESTVSDLIDVKRFIQPLLKQNYDENITGFFTALERSFKSSGIKDVDQKIHECCSNLHSLKALYNHVANRGERTKEIVDNIVQKGKFVFSLKENFCEVHVEYKQDKKTLSHSKGNLNDLRSRALLILNTEEKQREKVLMTSPNKKENLPSFIHLIDTAMDICQICVSLKGAGHFRFSKFEKKVHGKKDMNTVLESLKSEYQDWCQILTDCRMKYHVMNYVYADQMHMLFEYMKYGKHKKAVATLLKFINPSMSCFEKAYQAMKKELEIDEQNLRNALESLGKSLHGIWSNMLPIEDIHFPLKHSSQKASEMVQRGRLFIAALPEDSQLVIRTLMALYFNTTGRVPRAFNVLLCTRQTSSDEIVLLLNRCLGNEQSDLFTIANVETLNHENQAFLVEKLKSLPSSLSYRLAILCKGSEHHPFFDKFSDFVMHPKPLTENQLSKVFNDEWPHVSTITSDVPGLGKTELIHEIAFEKNFGVITLHISGPFEKETIVEHLVKLNMQQYNILHIDVGQVNHPSELDAFLFELVVLKYVSSRKFAFALETDHICIEIANSVNHELCNSLPTVTCFKRKNLTWENYDNMKISQEICSPVQVVCHYLQAIDNGHIDQTDIYLVGKEKVTPISKDICRSLLQKHFSTSGDLSFTIVNIFLGVLADQLKKLSTSVFFRTSNVQHKSIKSQLVTALKNMSSDFSARSINSCRSSQIDSITAMKPSQYKEDHTWAETLASRTAGMIRWEDSNHLMVLFHQDLQTVSALYRNKDKVPKQIAELFESQLKRKLENFSEKKQSDLQKILLKLVQHSSQMTEEELNKISQNYALTPDNLLKMILIILRTKGHQPVIIMGETGCGKTSLIRYLSKLCSIEFEVMSIHAGITENMIICRVNQCNEKAKMTYQKIRWLFLDEINTCDHLGLISDILCHHRCKGNLLSPNLVVMAACNPYRLRSDKSILTSGLTGKVKTDLLSKLVYRVHPLPETMIDYVWDYGSLSESDEESYIERMVQGIFTDKTMTELLVQLLTLSQHFVRQIEGNDCSVSLRDVERCKRLIIWFKQILKKKKRKTENYHYKLPQGFDICSIILSLGICYHSRFPENNIRLMYRNEVASACKNIWSTHIISESDVEEIIVEEQNDILDRMELPPGTAKNTALRENVFVILVCILNRIPVFVVGKPGCSKSLSMQLIRSNLRGKDSSDEFFKLLPQFYCVSFQGSESSTSDGIMKVFDKAKNYQNHNNLEDVMSVVILDEIGLAEISRFNPLKVLHSLLEPENQICPDVAVVGISNWALDAAKMNRAIHLSRPEMDEKELFETGLSISLSLIDQTANKAESKFLFAAPKKGMPQKLNKKTKNLLREIASAYFNYNKQQKFKNFHGLRDFYSLIKYISKGLLVEDNDENSDQIIIHGLKRNLGGLPMEIQNTMMTIFKPCIHTEVSQEISVLDLIQDNIEDRTSRHLMLITNGDAVLSVLEDKVKDLKRQHVVIFGSQFEDDLTDDYNYRILSRIILCMEQGYVLILKDLENIYGSLYDMLNQNYTIVGNKKNCRVALGPYSNPMCHVHEDFKCIVLVEETKLDYSDPPFLNRFEKQQFSFTDLMDEPCKIIKHQIEEMIESFCETENQSFIEEEVFALSGEDIISSLVLSVQKTCGMQENTNDVFLQCQKQLLWITAPDAVMRLHHSSLWKSKAHTVRRIEKEYLALPIHDGLLHFLNTLENKQENTDLETEGNPVPSYMVAVFTNSNIHTNVTFGDRLVQVERLSSFKSEKHLSRNMQQYFASDKNLLVLHCNVAEDFNHILLAKLTIENCKRTEKTELGSRKNVCLIFHMSRKESGVQALTQINFLSGWELVMLDSVEKPRMALPQMMNFTPLELLESRRPLFPHFKEFLFWAFTRIQHIGSGHTVDKMMELVAKVQNCDSLLVILEELVLGIISKQFAKLGHVEWQREVALKKHSLYSASCFVLALENYLLDLIKNPLCKIIFKLEESNAFHSFFVVDNFTEERVHLWKKMTLKDRLDEIMEIPDESGPECYPCSSPRLEMMLPYSFVILNKVEKIQEDFAYTLKQLKVTCDLEDDIPTGIFNDLVTKYRDLIDHEVSDFAELEYSSREADYTHDFCLFVSSAKELCLTDEERIKVLEWSLSLFGKNESVDFVNLISQLHITNWTYRPILSSVLKVINMVKEITNTSADEVIDRTKQLEKLDFLNKGESTEDDESQIEDELDEDADFDKSAQSRKCLTDVLCKILIPTQTIMSHFPSIDNWQHCVSSILPLLGTISLEPESIHALRFCNDLASAVKKLTRDEALSILCAVGGHFDNNECLLSTTETFHLIFDNLTLLNKSGKISTNRLQKLMCGYLSRCFAANPYDCEMMKMFLSTVTDGSCLDKNLSFFGPVLVFAIQIEQSIEEGVFEDIIDVSFEIEDDHPILQSLDDCVVKLSEQNNPDSCLATLLVDVLQEEIYSKLHTEENIGGIEHGSDKIVTTAFKACEVLKDQHGCSLKTIASVSYLKTFLSAYSELITNQKLVANNSILNSSLNALLETGDSLIELESHRSHSVLLYFLKVLHKSYEIHQLEKVVKSLQEPLPAMKCVKWNSEFIKGMISFNPFVQYNIDIDSILSAVSEMHQQKEEAIKSIMKKASTDQNEMLSVLGYLANQFYLKMAVKENNDSERKTATRILQMISADLPASQKFILKCLANSEDFHHSLFHLNPETKTPNNEIVSVLVHMLCLMNTKGTMGNLFFDLMTMPHMTKSRYFPGAVYELTDLEISQASTCVCGVRYSSMENFCPNCQKPKTPFTSEEKTQSSQNEIGYQFLAEKVKVITRFTSPSSHHVIHFFINGCVMLAHTCKFVDEVHVADFFGVNNSENPVGDLLQRVLFSGWNAMKSLIAVNDKDLCSLMHVVIYRLQDVFTKSEVPMICKTEKDREEVEMKIHLEVESVISELHRHILLVRREQYLKQKFDLASMECQLEEVSVIECPKERELLLPNLFHVTAEPTKENLVNDLFSSENRKNYPFLCMVIENEDLLSLPQNIIPILKWHQSTVSIGSYKIKKVDCKDKTIDSLLQMEKDEGRRRVLKKHFEEFKEAWNDLLNKQKSNLKTPLTDEDLISSKTRVIDCIITDNNSIIHKVLLELVAIHNSFIDKCLSLAASSPNVQCINFLSCGEGKSVVHTTTLWDLTSQDIVSFLWNDDILRYSQCKTCLGEGKERCYDFQKIEMEISHELILAKPYIAVPSTIPRVLFIDELFQNTIQLIIHVRGMIPQENLSSEIVSGILKKKEKDHSLITELMTLLGMVLSLLKKMNVDPSMPVIEYLETWKVFVTLSSASYRGLLPEPEDCVKICHVVNLYYFLEELNGASVLDSLELSFRDDLPNDGKHKLETAGNTSIKHLELLGRTIKVFVHRCLSSSENAIQLDQCLTDYLEDEQFWPSGTFHDQSLTLAGKLIHLKDILCDSISVNHVYETSKFIQDYIEEKKIMDQRVSSIAASYQAKSHDTAKKTAKKSKVIARKGFGKT